MATKGGSTAVVTAEQVTTALKSASVTSTEEKALRMRYGAKVDLTETLPQAHEGDQDLADELLLLEMRILRALKRRNAQSSAPKPAKLRSPTKAKIVRALRNKKK